MKANSQFARESLLRAHLSHDAVPVCGNVQLSPLYFCEHLSVS